MQKSKQIGVLLEDLSASQLTFYVIKNINDYLEKSDIDFVAFFQNSTASMITPRFSTMSVSETWSFSGTVIATSVSTALSIQKTCIPAKKYFYVWDLDWHRRGGQDFEYTIQAYNNPELNLIARSSSHAKAIKNYCNRDVCGIVDNFNIDQLIGVINNE